MIKVGSMGLNFGSKIELGNVYVDRGSKTEELTTDSLEFGQAKRSLVDVLKGKPLENDSDGKIGNLIRKFVTDITGGDYKGKDSRVQFEEKDGKNYLIAGNSDDVCSGEIDIQTKEIYNKDFDIRQITGRKNTVEVTDIDFIG